MSKAAVSVGDQVYVVDGAEAFGSVRYVHSHELVIFIEGTGDVTVPATAVSAVHAGKVIVSEAALPEAVRLAIAAAHRVEVPGA